MLGTVCIQKGNPSSPMFCRHFRFRKIRYNIEDNGSMRNHPKCRENDCRLLERSSALLMNFFLWHSIFLYIKWFRAKGGFSFMINLRSLFHFASKHSTNNLLHRNTKSVYTSQPETLNNNPPTINFFHHPVSQLHAIKRACKHFHSPTCACINRNKLQHGQVIFERICHLNFGRN